MITFFLQSVNYCKADCKARTAASVTLHIFYLIKRGVRHCNSDVRYGDLLILYPPVLYCVILLA